MLKTFSNPFKMLGLMVLALVLSTTAISCSKDDDGPSDPATSLIGTWVQTNQSGTVITLKFNNNRTGSINYLFPSGSDSNEYFEYNTRKDSDENLILFISGDDCQLAGQYVAILTPTSLTLDAGDYYYRFTRK